MRYWNVQEILKQAALELGIPSAIVLPATSDLVEQLLALLNSAGAEFVVDPTWTQLQRTWTLQTVANVAQYPLPSDWVGPYNSTQWDTTNRAPLTGPRSPQEWAWLKHSGLGVSPNMRYRVINDKLEIYPVPQVNPPEIQIDYTTNAWVDDLGTPKTMATKDTDVVLFDGWLMVKFIKFKFAEAKGFESTAAAKELSRALEMIRGRERGAPVLHLTRPDFDWSFNIPEGSWSP